MDIVLFGAPGAGKGAQAESRSIEGGLLGPRKRGSRAVRVQQGTHPLVQELSLGSTSSLQQQAPMLQNAI